MRWVRNELLHFEPAHDSGRTTHAMNAKRLRLKYTEDWMSGLNQRFTKPSSLHWDREFESHILRIDNLLVLMTHLL